MNRIDINKLSNDVIGAAIEVHKAQLLTCLKLSNVHLGLLLSFNVPILKDGIVRLANELKE